MVSSETTIRCPNNDCGARGVRNSRGDAIGIALFTTNTATGQTGYWASGATSVTVHIDGYPDTPGTPNAWTEFIPITANTDSFLEHASNLGRSQTQQTPLTEKQKTIAQNGINRASSLADNQRCKDFINGILQRAAAVIEAKWWGTSEKYVSTDGVYGGVDVATALWSYQNALNKGWVTSSGISGAHDGAITYGSTTPTGKYPVSWNKEFFDLNQDTAGLHTLHESLHQFPGFDDQILANAARFVANQSQRDFNSEGDPVNAASQNLNELIGAHCAPR
jgi:hypothetical protein